MVTVVATVLLQICRSSPVWEIATAAFYLAWLWGVLLIGVLAVVFVGQRAWIERPSRMMPLQLAA